MSIIYLKQTFPLLYADLKGRVKAELILKLKFDLINSLMDCTPETVINGTVRVSRASNSARFLGVTSKPQELIRTLFALKRCATAPLAIRTMAIQVSFAFVFYSLDYCYLLLLLLLLTSTHTHTVRPSAQRNHHPHLQGPSTASRDCGGERTAGGAQARGAFAAQCLIEGFHACAYLYIHTHFIHTRTHSPQTQQKDAEAMRKATKMMEAMGAIFYLDAREEEWKLIAPTPAPLYQNPQHAKEYFATEVCLAAMLDFVSRELDLANTGSDTDNE